MPNILLPCLLFLLLAAPNYAQTTVRFTPKWKVGDVRTAHIERHEREMKKGVVVEDTTYTMEAKYRVLAENATSVTLEAHYENVAMRAAVAFHDRIGEDLKEYRDLILKYRVDKATGNAELLNWKEASTFMDKSIQAIGKTIKKKAPDSAPFMELVWMPIRHAFKDRKNIEAYMAQEIDYLLFPFGKDFTIGDTLRIHDSAANPFNPADTVAQTTLAWLVDTDGHGTGTCDIHGKVVLDMTSFKEMIASLMRSIGGAFGADADSMEQKSQEIAAIEFDVSNSTVITMDEATTWPVTVVQQVLMTGSDREGTRENSVRATIKLR